MSMIRPLIIGNITFPINIILGPLAGYSCAPFRFLTWKYGRPAFSCTEMISSKGLIRQPRLAQQRYIVKDPEEGPVCFQLFGNDAQELAEATKIITDCGADLIDLNCGCPVRKVRKQGSGSQLLSDVRALHKLLHAMKQSTHLPVSAKIRVEGDSDIKFNNELAAMLNDSGVDFVVVHGRHWTERYNIPCHYDQIQFFVEQLKMPVIGNGDVACIKSMRKMFATGCAGVMIARAGVGRPWLVRELVAQENNEEFIAPSSGEIAAIFIEHVRKLAVMLDNEKFAVLQARNLAPHYARGLSHKREFCDAMNSCNNLYDLERLCMQYLM